MHLPPRVVVIGASTGGLDGLKIIVGDLPEDFAAALLIVQHVAASGINVMAEILDRVGPLPARTAINDQRIERGCIYVAPADHHLLVASTGRLRLSKGPKENRSRPAIDPLFRSAAVLAGPRVIGVVLSGELDDGTAGLWAIRERGGITIVQNPEEAVAPSMPLNALKHVEVHHIARLSEIGRLLVRLSREPVSESQQPVPPAMETELKIAREDAALPSGVMTWGEPSTFACPECHGVLLQRKEGERVRFRCHTGHAYSLAALFADYAERAEEEVWSAVRSIQEMQMLLEHAGDTAAQHGHNDEAAALRRQAADWRRRAALVRQAVIPGTAARDDARANGAAVPVDR